MGKHTQKALAKMMADFTTEAGEIIRLQIIVSITSEFCLFH